MRKTLILLLTFFILIFSSTFAQAAASNDPLVKATVEGTVDKDSNVTILLTINNINNFYAGQVNLKYDNQVLKVDSIEKGELITQSGINSWEAVNKFDNAAGNLEYAFTCLGQTDGFKGSGALIKIHAKVLKKDNFHIDVVPPSATINAEKNLKLEMCTKDPDNKITDMSYIYTAYDFIAKTGTAVVSETTVVKEPPTESNVASNSSGSPETTPNSKVSTSSKGTTSNVTSNSTENKNIKGKSPAYKNNNGNTKINSGVEGNYVLIGGIIGVGAVVIVGLILAIKYSKRV